MGTKLEELFYELSAKHSKLDSDLKKATTSMDRATGKMASSTDRLEKKSSKHFGGVSGAATLMAGVLGGNIMFSAFQKLTGFVSNAFTNLRFFSQGIAEINTLLPRNSKLTKESADQFLKFAKLYGQSTRKQTKAFYDIVSAGVKGTAKQMRVLDQANKAAVAGITDVGTAADILTSIMNSYAATGIDVTEISDQLFATVVEGKTTFGQLAGVVGTVAPIASAAGVSFAEMSGTLAFLTKAGLDSAKATTGLRAILVGIIKPTEDAARFAKELGIDFTVAGLRSKGFAGFMAEVREKTNGSTDAIAKLFPNIRALNPALQIVNADAKDFNQILKNVADSGGATTLAMEEVKKSMDFKLKRAGSSIEAFGIQLLQMGEGAIGLGADIASAVFSPIIEGGLKAKPTIEKITASIDILTKQLAKAKKDEAGGGFLDKLLGKSGDIEKKIEELKALREEMVKTKAAGGGPGGQGPDDSQTKVFTAAQKEAGEAGKELATSIAESSRSIEDTHTRRLDAVTKNLDAEKVAIAQKQQEGVISTSEALKETQAIEEQAFTDKISAEEARREMLLEQVAMAREQDLISDTEHKATVESINKEHEGRVLTETTKSRKSLATLNKQQRSLELQQRADFLSTAATLARSENKALAVIGKTAAITQIAIKTPPAVANSYEFGTKLGGPITGAVFAGIAGLAMGAQAAAIAGVPLQTGLTEVPSGFPNDSFQARLQTGERVVNEEQNTDLKDFLESQKNGGGNTFIFQGDFLGLDSEETALKIMTLLRDFQVSNGGELTP